MEKLSKIRLVEREMDEAKTQAEAREKQIDSLKAHYGALDRAEGKRRRLTNRHKEQKKRAAPYRHHYCDVTRVWKKRAGPGLCYLGYRSVFAPSTPDEKVLQRPGKVCESSEKRGKLDQVRQACEKYQEAFLVKRGLDIGSIIVIRIVGDNENIRQLQQYRGE